ncbi:glycosyltransferase family 2 protein [Pseudoalteromonas sp. CST5]|uniref:glycosyltransferase family 2 protein n=1 Tax=unclassified Pseudoalteromonas TaxID=194690 RepID=UPI00235962A4|nr:MULTISPECIES: glycosyltransferase family 2 protein [unclassified Pseudoalteromonas]MDC9513030.1 glycosyltransferase family 2 protein [Pseudoalteromonas sp. CST1]MDC9537233.1 glycosyltransferase family 2 protein [Pseudoalteromonas sp. CST3]MDC9541547.1 glycosyltransferase family 2 protein [Pseudoalteromonas sp. CST2]MDC9544394.1 glycosyltransferase family 2 protein [Pseudoalteromonas sp. CST4]MDC9548578.1 glycosyltransferase family 2 protein [Pseudoalteromonas sp. CST5]
MIGAVLVVYKPDLALTERLLTRLYGQTEEVVIVDNSPTPHDFTKVIKHYHYIHLADNSGIAHAHNAGLLYLLKAGCEYAILLDQDSLIPSDMVFNLSSLLKASYKIKQNVVAIGPRIRCSFSDKKVNPKIQKEVFEYDDLVGVTQIIASGMMIDLSALDQIGLKDESLFIDGVDHEWCWRARSMGFDIAKAKNVEMVHRLGDSRSKFIGVTYKVGAPIRLYYQFRNILLLSRRPYVPTYWKVRCLFFMPIRLFLNSVMQKNRLKRLGFMLQGIVDGVLGRKGPYKSHWK